MFAQVSDAVSTSCAGEVGCYSDFVRTYLTVGSPIKFSDMKVEITGSPLLGEHTDEVLAELGYSADKIATLHAAKAV